MNTSNERTAKVKQKRCNYKRTENSAQFPFRENLATFTSIILANVIILSSRGLLLFHTLLRRQRNGLERITRQHWREHIMRVTRRGILRYGQFYLRRSALPGCNMFLDYNRDTALSAPSVSIYATVELGSGKHLGFSDQRIIRQQDKLVSRRLITTTCNIWRQMQITRAARFNFRSSLDIL